MFTPLRCKTDELFFSFYDCVAAHFKHAATRQPVEPLNLRRQHREATATGIGLGITAKYMQQTASGNAGSFAAFIVNSELQTGARSSVRLCVGLVAPTEVTCEFLKSSFFVVAVFLWSNGVVIRINMHRKATRTPQMVSWGWGEGRKKYF
jgi:hypothetical protein